MSRSLSKSFQNEAVAYDQSARAEATLDHILDVEKKEKDPNKIEYATVAEELLRARLLDNQSNRTRSRVLFVTTTPKVLEEGSATQVEYKNLTAVFDEVHVLVLVPQKNKNTSKRIDTKVWVYTVHHSRWWRLPWEACEKAYDLFTFNGVVRPDVVVAVDPFEAGLAGYFIAREFARPFQIHAHTELQHSDWVEASENNKWRKWIARYVLKRTHSVRTSTQQLKKYFSQQYKHIKDIAVLPKFQNISAVLKTDSTTDLHHVYPQFSFIMVAFGPLTADSHLHDTFAALRTILLTRHIGLVVVGSGRGKSLFSEKVEILGISDSVVFVEDPEHLYDHYKTANVLISTDISSEGEVHVVRAAAGGVPIVAYQTAMRDDLFEHNESALLVPAGDAQQIGKEVAKLINRQALRTKLSRNAKVIAKERLQEDPSAYYRSIRDTIEAVLVASPSEVSPSSPKE